MKRKEFGNILLFVMIAVLGVIYGCVKLMNVPESIIYSTKVTIVIGILVGVGVGAGIVAAVNNIRNNRLDQKLWDDMNLNDKLEVTKVEDTNN